MQKESNKVIRPEVLILSNKHDYSTDHVAFQLEQLGASYFRINRDQFSEFELSLFPAEQILIAKLNELTVEVSLDYLKSIYFRAPVFLRDNYQPGLTPNEQLSRGQWSSFIRAFMVFDKVIWVNDPKATYLAETKPYQLYRAQKVGFKIPQTVITNTPKQKMIKSHATLVVKTLDSAVLNLGSEEAFIYTNFTDSNELLKANLSTAPVIMQEPILPKIDIRVTVIGKKAFPVSITDNGVGCNGDWRLNKNNLRYEEIDLPSGVLQMCIELTRDLDLSFGGIDLAKRGNEYFFIEINPTGEWAWLMKHTKRQLDREIAMLLLQRSEE